MTGPPDGVPEQDAVVVGAGPGGSSAAYHLARLGHRVLLVDRQAFPRDKSCGDGLTRAAMVELASMDVSAEELRGRAARGVRVSMRGRGERLFDYPSELRAPTHGLVVPRVLLDQVLCRRAVAAGAELWERTLATALLLEDGVVRGVAVDRNGQREELRSAVVIAADGAASRLARQARLVTTTDDRMGFAIRVYVERIHGLEDRLEIAMPLLDPTDRYLLPSYGWVFPIGPDSANVGVGLFERDHGTNVSELLIRFLAVLRDVDPRFSDSIVRGRARGAPLRFDFAPERSFASGLMLVGDAAGMISPFTGEGISFALESGRVAAELVDELLADGRGTPEAFADLSEYGARLGGKYTGYFEAGQHAARRYRVVWHVLENSFRSERPMFALARQAVLFPEGVGESFVEAAFHDVRSYLGPVERRVRHDLVSVAQIALDETRRDWPFLTRASAFDRSADQVPYRPALLLLLSSYFGDAEPMQTTLAAAALELGYLGALAQVSVENDGVLERTLTDLESSPVDPTNWANMLAVMMADFLFGKAYRMTSTVGSWLSGEIADAVSAGAEARVRELRYADDLALREAELVKIVEEKVAVLFELPCRIGAALGGLAEDHAASLETYGRALGVAFELVEQVHELDGRPRRVGTAARAELADGPIGLPVVLAARREPERSRLGRLMSRRPLGPDDVEEVRQVIRDAGGREATVEVAQRYADKSRAALRNLPPGDPRTALEGLVDFTLAQADAARPS